MNEEVKKEAEALKNKLTALDEAVKNGANKEEMDKAISNLKSEIESSKENHKSLTEKLSQISEELETYKENVTKNGKKGELSEFFKKNAESFDAKDKHYQTNYTIKAPALMTTANIIPVGTDGWSPIFNNYIDTNVEGAPKPSNFMMQLVDVRTQQGAEAIYFSDRINEEGDAEFIGEGTLKPLADAEWQTVKKNIKEVALRWKFTKRLMQHAPSVEADFREHCNELIEQKMDDVALTGDEASNADEFDGIAALSDAFVVPTELANYYPAANIYDAIMAVATFVRLNNFRGQLTCVLNTVWRAKMQGIKEGDSNNYIVPPFVTADGSTVGEVRVRFENKMPADKILLGDMSKYHLVIAEDVEYDEGFENDDFSKNLVSRKLEAFLGSYKKASDAGSIVFDDISTVLTPIESI